jgi:hypothetical protein
VICQRSAWPVVHWHNSLCWWSQSHPSGTCQQRPWQRLWIKCKVWNILSSLTNSASLLVNNKTTLGKSHKYFLVVPSALDALDVAGLLFLFALSMFVDVLKSMWKVVQHLKKLKEVI